MAQNATIDRIGSTANAIKDWDRMTMDQQRETFEKLSDNQRKGKNYVEWLKEGYHHQYENWMPWIEDQYLKWFTNDNKASYATKENLDKTKVSGVDQVDTLQDGINNTIAGQVGKGGSLQPSGDMASKEGINRVERSGKDEHGRRIPNGPAGLAGAASAAVQDAYDDGAHKAGSYIGSMLQDTKP